MAETTGNMNIYPELDNAIPFRFEVNIIKDYFIVEICKRETMSKTLSKYIAAFDYFDNSFLVLSAASGSVSIALFATIIVALVEKTSASLNLVFSISSGITKKLFKTMRKKIKKHNKIISYARSKLNNIENIMSQALIDDEISLEDFRTILNEEKITHM